MLTESPPWAQVRQELRNAAVQLLLRCCDKKRCSVEHSEVRCLWNGESGRTFRLLRILELSLDTRAANQMPRNQHLGRLRPFQ